MKTEYDYISCIVLVIRVYILLDTLHKLLLQHRTNIYNVYICVFSEIEPDLLTGNDTIEDKWLEEYEREDY